MPWFDSAIIVTFFKKDGALYALSGDLRPTTFAKSTTALDKIEARSLFANKDIDDLVVDDTSEAMSDEARGVVRRGIDPETRAPAWDYVGPEGTARLDERTGTILREQRGGDDAYQKTCQVMTDAWTLDASNRMTNVNAFTGTTNYMIPCEGDQVVFTSNCDYKLRDLSHDQPLEQINDGNFDDSIANEYIVMQPCSLTTPVFNVTIDNYAEQREAYSWLWTGAEVAKVRLFDNITPDSSGAVELHTDTDTGSTASARYSDANRDIYFKNGAVSPAVVWHEYGHHVANMYGNFDNICTAFVNEGDALDEATGAMVGMLTLARQVSGLTPVATYGAMRGMGIGLSGAHTTTTNRRTYNGTLCGIDEHDAAIPFAQAFWEVLTNRNCESVTCTTSSTSFLPGSSGGLTTLAESSLENRVGYALAEALKISPPNTTFATLLALMRASWEYTISVPSAAAMNAVFDHHGF